MIAVVSRMTANLLAVACSTALSCYRTLHVRELTSFTSILLVLAANKTHSLRLSSVPRLPRPFAARGCAVLIRPVQAQGQRRHLALWTPSYEQH